MSKIIITGGAGFIGSHLAKSLARSSHQVTVLDNMSSYYDVELKRERVMELEKHGVKVMLADITLDQMIKSIFTDIQPDIVYHLAAQPGVQYSIDHPNKVIAANITGTSSVFQACEEVQPERVYYASSSSVYGEVEGSWEESRLLPTPLSLYAATKQFNEQLAGLFHTRTQIPTVGLRFFTVYGPSGRPDMAYWKFTEKILKGEKINLYGRNATRDFTYVDDVMKALSLLEDHPVTGHEIFNIGGGNPVSVLDMILTLQEVIGIEAMVEIESKRYYDPIITCANTEKLQRAIGQIPNTPLQEGLEKFYTWYNNRV